MRGDRDRVEITQAAVAILTRALPDRPEWIASSGEPELRPREGYVVSFVSFHERGLGLSADRFMRALPHYYGVELHNFNPNSIAQAAIFVTVYEGYLGIAPHWELWLHLF